MSVRTPSLPQALSRRLLHGMALFPVFFLRAPASQSLRLESPFLWLPAPTLQSPDPLCRIGLHGLQERRGSMVHPKSPPESARFSSVASTFRFPLKRQSRLQVPSEIKANKKWPPCWVAIFTWCGRWDLNPYACAHAPQTCLSANSSTAAHHVSIAVWRVVVNPFYSFF